MVGGASNEALARHIAGLGIDILVDLNSYSTQERLPLFMHRAAPIQASWFNTYAPTGLDCFDLLIADEATLPPEEERFFAEEIVRLPGSYLTFAVDYAVPDAAAPPAALKKAAAAGAPRERRDLLDERRRSIQCTDALLNQAT